jgi:recombination protein RecA
MANTKKDLLPTSLRGFCRRGAHEKSPGNIPTGHFKLDFAIQYGMDVSRVDLSKIEGYDPSKTLGIPLGKLVEIFGEEGGGKSSLGYRIAGFAQKLGHEVAWIDVEHSYQENLAKLNGCDIDQMYYSNLLDYEDPDNDFYAENIFDKMIEMMKVNIKVIVLDSVANLVPKALFEADSEQQFMGLLPRMLSQHLGKLVSYAEKYGTLLVFINQLRENLRVHFGDPETSPGGHSLKHNASLRLKISKKSGKDANIYIPDPDNGDNMLIGRHSGVRLVKNRFAKPFLETLDIPIYYEPYFPGIEDIAFDTARQIKLISVRDKIFNWDGLRIEGRKGFIDHLVEHKLVSRLIESINGKASEDGVILPPEISFYNSALVGDNNEKNAGQISGDVKEENSQSGKDNIKKAGRKKSS